MAKKEITERDQDVPDGENHDAIEAHVKEMMETDSGVKPENVGVAESATAPPIEPTPPKKTIQVVHHSDVEDERTEVPSAPPIEAEELLAVEEQTEPNDNPTPEDQEEPEEPDELALAIEEANKQLQDEVQASSAAPLDDELVEVKSDITPRDEETSEELAETQTSKNEIEHGISEIISDPETDKAIDEIVKTESDALLQAEDEKLAAVIAPRTKTSFSGRLKNILMSKRFKRTVFAAILLGIVVAGVVPASRYYVLNAAGVRSAASLRVLDASTRQPMRNVTVQIAGQEAQSDEDGNVRLGELRLGSYAMTIQKRAFAERTENITVGLGSNPFGEFNLVPTGSQYTFTVTDFLATTPIVKAEAVSEDASAFSDEDGIIKLTIEDPEATRRAVTIRAQGYRDEVISIDLDSMETRAVSMVAGRKSVFVSNREGRFDLFSIDADGKNEQRILPGTGSERDDIVIESHPTDEVVAYVSTRENKRNADGFLLSTLTIIQIEGNKARSIAQSERVQVVGWHEDHIVYVQVAAGASAANPKRHRLVSHNYVENETKELASANYFNDVKMANGRVFYAPASAYSGRQTSNLHSVNPDGSDQKIVFEQEIWSMFRLTYESLTLSLQQEWFTYALNSDDQPGKISPPANPVSRNYVVSPDGSKALWVDVRDGKGVLLSYNIESKEDTALITLGGLKQPVRWLNDTTIQYRLKTEQESADYVLSTLGGEPVKIQDVTDTNTVDRWFYF